MQLPTQVLDFCFKKKEYIWSPGYIQYVILIWFTGNPILDDLLPKHKSKVLDTLSTEIAMK